MWPPHLNLFNITFNLIFIFKYFFPWIIPLMKIKTKNNPKQRSQYQCPEREYQCQRVHYKQVSIHAHLSLILALGVAEPGVSPIEPARDTYTAVSYLNRKWGWGGWCCRAYLNSGGSPTYRTHTSNSKPRIRGAHQSSAFTRRRWLPHWWPSISSFLWAWQTSARYLHHQLPQ